MYRYTTGQLSLHPCDHHATCDSKGMIEMNGRIGRQADKLTVRFRNRIGRPTQTSWGNSWTVDRKIVTTKSSFALSSLYRLGSVITTENIQSPIYPFVCSSDLSRPHFTTFNKDRGRQRLDRPRIQLTRMFQRLNRSHDSHHVYTLPRYDLIDHLISDVLYGQRDTVEKLTLTRRPFIKSSTTDALRAT